MPRTTYYLMLLDESDPSVERLGPYKSARARASAFRKMQRETDNGFRAFDLDLINGVPRMTWSDGND